MAKVKVNLAKVVKEKCGPLQTGIWIQWHLTRRVEDLNYADDLALLSHRLQDMRSKMEDLTIAGEKVALKVNAEKTKLVKVMTTQEAQVRMGQELIEEVERSSTWAVS